jgi:UDP-glucose 4-epimerase
VRVLVTGGCGYIGSATARFLRGRGHDVLALDDFSTGHRAAWDGACVEADLTDPVALDAALVGRGPFDGVIHFAARAAVGESVAHPLRYWRQNLLPVLHLCERLPGLPFVFSSTCAVYGQPAADRLHERLPCAPVNPYGATKAAAERLLFDRAAAGQGGCAALRYFNAAGAEPDGSHGEHHEPEEHLIPRAIAAALGAGPPLQIYGADWATPDGTCVRDCVHVLDLAAAHLAALERLRGGGASGAWNLGTGTGHSVRQVLAAVERACGRPVPHSVGARRPGDPAVLVADASLARRELAWRPAFEDLGEIVQTAVSWLRSHPRGYLS